MYYSKYQNIYLMQCGSFDYTLEEKKDISGKTIKIQIKFLF